MTSVINTKNNRSMLSIFYQQSHFGLIGNYCLTCKLQQSDLLQQMFLPLTCRCLDENNGHQDICLLKTVRPVHHVLVRHTQCSPFFHRLYRTAQNQCSYQRFSNKTMVNNAYCCPTWPSHCTMEVV